MRSCGFPFGVFSATAVEDWARIRIFCPPPRPQRPPRQPQGQPQRPPRQPQGQPQQPPPLTFPPRYELLMPSAIAANMDVFFHSRFGTEKILPADQPIWLRWSSAYTRCPILYLHTRNRYIKTDLRRIKVGEPCTYKRIGIGDPSLLSGLTVLQIVFSEKRWIVVSHVVVPSYVRPFPSAEDLRNAYNNRKETLITFYDSHLSGLDVVYVGKAFVGAGELVPLVGSGVAVKFFVALHASYADILLKTMDGRTTLPIYTVRPTANPAYAMFIFPVRG